MEVCESSCQLSCPTGERRHLRHTVCANMQRGQESDNHEATALQDTGCFLWERQASASLCLAVRIDTKMTADKTVQTDNLKHSHYQ